MTIQPSTPSVSLPNAPLTATLLNLKIRFSHSELTDLPLLLPSSLCASSEDDATADISAASSSVNNLKGRIRASLPEAWRKHGLKLIYGGRVLDGRDNVLLALRLSLPAALQATSTNGETWADDSTTSNPARNADDPDTTNANITNKGKARASPLSPSTTTSPIYIHCAITPTPLDPRTLQQQLSLETAPAPTTLPLPDAATTSPQSNNAPQHHDLPAPQPQGFDRLLAPASGFNPSDVAALRAQFRAIIGTRYTPDTMPGAGTLLRMEEAWLDDSSSLPAGGSGSASAGGRAAGGDAAGGAPDSAEQGAAAGLGAGAGGYTDDDGAAALDDTLYGVFVGFFWPLGACVWGLREEGVWSRRRGWAVLAGILVNIAFGVVRVLS